MARTESKKSSVCASASRCLATKTTGTKASSQSTGLRRISSRSGVMEYDFTRWCPRFSCPSGREPLIGSLPVMVLFAKLVGCRAERLNADRSNEAGQHDAGKAYDHREDARQQ